MLTPTFWNNYFKVYNYIAELYPYQESLAKIVEATAASEDSLLLDVGCGTGLLSDKFKAIGVNVVGVDLSEKGLELYRSKDSNAVLVQGDISQALPFQKESFSHIVMRNVLYAVPDDLRISVLKNIYGLLKPAGKFVLSNPHDKADAKKIILAHCKKSLKINGFFKMILWGARYFCPLLRIAYYNSKIKKATEQKISFLSAEQQRSLLAEAGFAVLSEEYACAKQEILHSSIKKI